MRNDIAKVLVSEEALQARIAELGKEISRDYADKNPIFLGVLKGVVPFFGAMLCATTIPCEIDFLSVSSYHGGTETSGSVIMRKDVEVALKDRHVIILEDILDTGYTLSYVVRHLQAKGPASVKICTLLDKPDRRKVQLDADYVGFTVPNEFVVGFGLDYDEKYRNLPFIGVLKPEVYEK